VKKPLGAVDQMYLEGLAMKRQQFRRSHPHSSEAEVERMVREWINDRPFDSPGRARQL
jgi:hypothetical protein